MIAPAGARSDRASNHAKSESVRRSSLRDRHTREATEPVRPAWELDGRVLAPGLPSSGVGDDELTIALQGLEARPPVSGSGSGSQVASRLAACRLATPGLMEHSAASAYALPSALARGGGLGLHGAHTLLELRKHLRGGAQLGRNRQRQLDLCRHGALSAKEVPRSSCP